jgi:ribosomal protein S6--L-glutamate ligase
LLAAVKQATGYGVLIDMDQISTDLANGSIRSSGASLVELDAIIVKKMGHDYSPRLLDRLEILKYLERGGVRVFSQTASLALAINRLAGTLRLRQGDIPMPATLITEIPELAVDTVRSYGKAILKPLYSSKARGMRLVSADDPDLPERIRAFQANGNQMIYLQQQVQLNGRDLGLAFLGGEYLATYARVSEGEAWSTTTHHGGKYEPFDPDPEIIKLAQKAQDLFDLDFTCVDVAITAGGPVVFEVSAFGGFRGLKAANNIDAATLYTEYVLNELL